LHPIIGIVLFLIMPVPGAIILLQRVNAVVFRDFEEMK